MAATEVPMAQEVMEMTTVLMAMMTTVPKTIQPIP
jgi:hypothetical protein